MGKKFCGIFTIILCVILISAFLAGCRGCKALFDRPSASDCIPSEIGSPEGLWLYKRNTRTRTDGSEKEELITDIVSPSGKEYLSDQWSICRYYYVTKANKVLFVITASDEIFLYGYDYKNKAGTALYDLPSTDVMCCWGDEKIFVQCERLALLFDYDLNLLFSDEHSYKFKDGILYSEGWNGNSSFFWYYLNGLHKLTLPLNKSNCDIRVLGEYIYVIYNETIVAINMYTESVTSFDVFDTTFDTDKYGSSRRIFEKFYQNDNELYVFSVTYKYLLNDPDEETDWFYELHKITNDKAELAYDFGSARWGAVMNVYENSLYFQVDRGGQKRYIHYYRYDIGTGKISEIKKSEYRETPKTDNKQVKKVGEYEFYTSSTAFGHGAWGEPVGYFYYLNRKHGDKIEVMQYSNYNDDFFDDICEF